MDFNRPNNRPTPRVTPAPRPADQTSLPSQPVTSVESYRPHQAPERHMKPRHSVTRVLLLSITGLLLLGGGYALGSYLPRDSGKDLSRVDSSKHQAVFLTNDQVYFGKVVDITDDVVVMENIYYLQENAASGTDQTTAAPKKQSNVALAKLGNELHGPEDQMQINRDQVMFWENLKSDSKVSEAIKAYRP